MQPIIAIIHTTFGPYHLARAQAFKQIYPGRTELIQLASQEQQRQWKVSLLSSEVTTIAVGSLETLDSKTITKHLLSHLSQIEPALVVIAGYGYSTMRAAALWAKQQKSAAILLSDSQHADKKRFFVQEKLKGWWVTQNFSAAFVAGASAALYLKSLGFPQNRIWRGYDVVNNSHFIIHAEKAHQAEGKIRTKLNLPKQYFLYVGRFSAEKNILALLKAYRIYRKSMKANAWSLVLVGGGPQNEEIKDQLKELDIQQTTHILEFQQIDDLPQYYGLASAFILPSMSEPWGLVVNEAMACGLPVLVSERCGCFLDLVFPGINGYIFNPLKIEDMARAMLKISAKSDEERQIMGEASKRIIANYTPETWAQALNDCAQTLLAQQNHRSSQS